MKVLKEIIRIGKLREESGIILDFGCGFGHLKRLLPEKKVVGYDIIPELSDVKDYRTVKPSVIVCNGVLEHLTMAEIHQLLYHFYCMNDKAIIITGVPTENTITIPSIFRTHE